MSLGEPVKVNLNYLPLSLATLALGTGPSLNWELQFFTISPCHYLAELAL